MIRWVIVVFLALMLINWFTPLVQRLGFGKLPGDFRFRLFGKEFFTTRNVATVEFCRHVFAVCRDIRAGDEFSADCGLEADLE